MLTAASSSSESKQTPREQRLGMEVAIADRETLLAALNAYCRRFSALCAIEQAVLSTSLGELIVQAKRARQLQGNCGAVLREVLDALEPDRIENWIVGGEMGKCVRRVSRSSPLNLGLSSDTERVGRSRIR
jgi:hypothetical protein